MLLTKYPMKNFTQLIGAVSPRFCKAVSNYGRYLLVVAALIGLSTAGRAQTAASYGYTAFSATYNDIVGGTPTGPNILTDDGTQQGIPIGFTFNFCGVNY